MDALHLIFDPENVEFRRISVYRFGRKKLKNPGMVELEIVLINFSGGTTVIRSHTCVKIWIYGILITKQEHDLRVDEIVVTKVKFAMNEKEK